MGTIINWVRATRGWVRSPYGDLPQLRVDDGMAHQTWLILAGGLALILSRASASELESRFAATRQLYALARSRLDKRRLPKPDTALLRDALQEIANLADPMTREAGRECLGRAVERLARKSGVSTQESSRPPLASQAAASQTSGQAPLTPTPAPAAEEEPPATRLDLDLLFERSNKLRGAVASARSTTFGPDN